MSDRSEEAKRLDELWTRFVARERLSADDRQILVAALEADEGLRRRLMLDLQLDGALRAAGEIERGQESLIEAVRALVTAAGRTEEVVAAVRSRLEAKVAARGQMRSMRGVRPSRVVAALLMVGGAAAALAMLLPDRPSDSDPLPSPSAALSDKGQAGQFNALAPTGGAAGGARGPQGPAHGRTNAPPGGNQRVAIARLVTSEGPAFLHGADGTQRAGAALDLAAGDWVSISGPAARARLTGPGGSRIEITGDAVAGLTADSGQPQGARFFLAHGRATAVVPRAAGAPLLTLASPHAIITGTGTLRLDVGTSTTRVEVNAGRARVSAMRVQHPTEVEAGQFALVRADDVEAPLAQAGQREALLVTGPDDTKEGPTPSSGLRASEEQLKARLERLGFQVSVVDDAALTPDRARAAAVLVLSSSVSSTLLGPWFGEMPVPMLVLESTGFEQLGLTGKKWRRDVGPAPPVTEILIENPGHPLAAGMTGTVRVLAWPLNMRWAAPAPGASVIATYSGAPEKASLLFGYERGTATAAGTAPARRVGLFLGNGRIIRALNEQGWRFFDAAVTWAAGS